MMKGEDGPAATAAEEDPLIPGTDELIPEKSSSAGEAKKRATGRKSKSPSATTSRKALKKKDENAMAVAIKYAALVLLVGQMVGLVLLMSYTRTHKDPGQPLYLASTAVFVMEVMKLIICSAVIAYQSGGDLFGELNRHVVQAPVEMLKLSVPSFLYTVQNNLLYLALTNLDAATYQVCYQLKILTTALFSMIMLQVRLSSSFHTLFFSITMATWPTPFAFLTLSESQSLILFFPSLLSRF